MVAAFWMFAASLLLAYSNAHFWPAQDWCHRCRTALLTPWLFEAGRLVFDAHLPAFTVVLFLLAAYRFESQEMWNSRDIAALAGSLGLVAMDISAACFGAYLRARATLVHDHETPFVRVIMTWLAYGVTLVPLTLFNRSHPGVLTKQLYEVSYVRPDYLGSKSGTSVLKLIHRYLEDQSLTPLLITGDSHPRHNVQGSGGVILLATFILAMIGLGLIIVHRSREPSCRVVLYGLVASVLPVRHRRPFRQMPLIGYAVFLLVLTIPALKWLLRATKQSRAQTA